MCLVVYVYYILSLSLSLSLCVCVYIYIYFYVCVYVCKGTLLVTPTNLHPFFEYVQLPNFDVSGPAFTLFKNMLFTHKEMGASYLLKHYDAFFVRYVSLLTSDNFATKKQAFEFLHNLLIARTRLNIEVLIRFTSQPENLRVVMKVIHTPLI